MLLPQICYCLLVSWSAYGLHEASIERTRHPFWGNFSMQPCKSDRRAHPVKNSIRLILLQAVARPVAELVRHEPGSSYIGLVRSGYGWSRRRMVAKARRAGCAFGFAHCTFLSSCRPSSGPFNYVFCKGDLTQGEFAVCTCVGAKFSRPHQVAATATMTRCEI
jgi:hypothetical protein